MATTEVTPALLESVYRLGQENNGELTHSVIQSKLNVSPQVVVDIINRLAQARVCALRKDKHGQAGVWCKLRSEETIQKLKTVDPTDYRVYCVIEESHNTGIWTADIRKLTGLQTHQIQRSVKQLCDVKGVIKPVKNIHVKNRKLYMVSELQPAKEIAGGSFYSQGEFNEQLVEHLRTQVSQYLMTGQSATLQTLAEYVRTSGDLRMGVSDDDLRVVLRTLSLDQSVMLSVAPHSGEEFYSWSKWGSSLFSHRSLPCGSCPVFNECYASRGHAISPQSCAYFSEWLGYDFELNVKEEF